METFEILIINEYFPFLVHATVYFQQFWFTFQNYITEMNPYGNSLENFNNENLINIA
jgi:E3 ubiquitin-protein ligase DOA10